MPLTTTQLLMREAVQRAADVVAFTDKHPVAAVNHLLNRGLGALSRVCRTVDPEFQPIASTTIVADGINTVFSLPSNFRSLLSVEYTDENDCKTWLTPYELGERPLLASASTTAYAIRATSYRLIGANIELLPRPPEDHEALLWYATSVTQLVDPTDTVDTMDRLDSYVIWWAAREIAAERENWSRCSYLTDRLTEMTAEIQILARSRDLSHPGRVVQAPRYRRRRR